MSNKIGTAADGANHVNAAVFDISRSFTPKVNKTWQRKNTYAAMIYLLTLLTHSLLFP